MFPFELMDNRRLDPGPGGEIKDRHINGHLQLGISGLSDPTGFAHFLEILIHFVHTGQQFLLKADLIVPHGIIGFEILDCRKDVAFFATDPAVALERKKTFNHVGDMALILLPEDRRLDVDAGHFGIAEPVEDSPEIFARDAVIVHVDLRTVPGTAGPFIDPFNAVHRFFEFILRPRLFGAGSQPQGKQPQEPGNMMSVHFHSLFFIR